ncbi:MAG: hypothetical protein PHR47_02340 [Candidatus Pacebacteria bacterium]|nr:hypothetical protein [Candidatus Paceibacterota bacterium]
MNNTSEIQNIKQYLDSLEGAKVKFSSSYNKKKGKNSFLKDLFAVIIVLGILCAFFFDDAVFSLKSKKANTTISGSGNYVCSDEISDIADTLKPTPPSDKTSLEIDNEMIRLNNEKTYIETEKVKIQKNPKTENTKNDEEKLRLRIEQYTKDIEAFNNKSTAYQKEIEEFNTKVKTYNNYLQDNCEKIKQDTQE